MKAIMTVIGTRPQYVKAAAVSRTLRRYFKEILIDTGQHYDHNLSGIFYEELDLPRPDVNLHIGSGSHGAQTAMMMDKLEKLVEQVRPDGMIVYGDTNSTLAGALVASKMKLPLFHIEAGLRSFNNGMPEEINRKLTDHVSTLLFAPAESAVNNLRKEGITGHVHQVGDVMLDAVRYYWEKSESAAYYALSAYGLEKHHYYLATIHRAENTDSPERLEAIIDALALLGSSVLFPLHPRTGKQLRLYGLTDKLSRASNIRSIEPVSYLAMLHLQRNAKAVITDSGGIQKEAYFAGVPCFTLRSETEWTETVTSGWNTLVNPLAQNLARLVEQWVRPLEHAPLYGDGRAAEYITAHLRDFYDTNCIYKERRETS